MSFLADICNDDHTALKVLIQVDHEQDQHLNIGKKAVARCRSHMQCSKITSGGLAGFNSQETGRCTLPAMGHADRAI